MDILRIDLPKCFTDGTNLNSVCPSCSFVFFALRISYLNKDNNKSYESYNICVIRNTFSNFPVKEDFKRVLLCQCSSKKNGEKSTKLIKSASTSKFSIKLRKIVFRKATFKFWDFPSVFK